MQTQNIPTLQIHKLTQEQYDTALAEGNIDETALYFTPDEGVDLSTLMSAINPVGTGSFSMNRLADSTVGDYSSTLGLDNTASGECGHAEGHCTTADAYQHVQGYFNTLSSGGSSAGGTSGSAFVIGNGTSSAASNAFRVSYAGKPYCLSALTTSGADYAEFFEWQDLNPNAEDRRGYFVTLNGDKIKIAEPNDYILGVVSALPAVIGNGDENWKGRYILDDFGAFITEEFEYEATESIEVVDEETGETKVEKRTVKKTGTKYKENPDYDPSIPYIQREDRPEWGTVGMMGVIAARDNGTCQVNGFCKVGEGGIATASDNGYRVIARVSENVVKIVFR